MDIFSCKHPAENEEFENLVCDPTHFTKNICNNWQTEKMQKLKFIDPVTEKEVIAKWSDLVAVYKIENSLCKFTKLNYECLKLKIFNKKNVVFLELDGYNDTTIFLKTMTTLWNCINGCLI